MKKEKLIKEYEKERKRLNKILFNSKEVNREGEKNMLKLNSIEKILNFINEKEKLNVFCDLEGILIKYKFSKSEYITFEEYQENYNKNKSDSEKIIIEIKKGVNNERYN